MVAMWAERAILRNGPDRKIPKESKAPKSNELFFKPLNGLAVFAGIATGKGVGCDIRILP